MDTVAIWVGYAFMTACGLFAITTMLFFGWSAGKLMAIFVLILLASFKHEKQNEAETELLGR